MAFDSVHIDPRAVTAALKQGTDVAGKLLELSEKLKEKHIPHSVDYESYAGARDPKFRTARLNDWARALIWELGSALLIFDVAPNHEEARRASRSKVCRVNAVTRDLEIVSYREASEAPPEAAATVERPRLVPQEISDYDLRSFGVSPEMARVGRALVDSDALDALGRLYPQLERQLHAIQLISEGMAPEEIFREISAIPDQPVDLADYSSALLRSITKQKLQVLASEEELRQAIQQPWDAWKTFLHPSQRALAYARRYNGPFRLTGGPGTGKTIVAVHRVRALVEEVGLFATGTPILLTAFNTTMAEHLQGLIESLLTEEQQRLVHVTGLDKLVYSRLKAGGHKRSRETILNQAAALEKRIDESPGRELIEWESARIRNFWDRVLLSMETRSWEEYSTLRRRVRKLPAVDQVTFERLENVTRALEAALVDAHETTFTLRTRDALECEVVTTDQFRHVVVDEAQDLHALHWRFLRRLVPEGPNDIFLVADCDQRIYRSPFPMSSCGIHVRNRSKRLSESYRCSQPILDFAYRILGAERGEDPDMAGVPERASALFSGPAPTSAGASDTDSEARMLIAKLHKWHAEGIPYGNMLVASVSSRNQELISDALSQAGLPAKILNSNERPLPEHVIIVTLARSKGMEAQVAAVFGASSAAIPVESMLPDELERQRASLFVAATRAREQLHVSWSGEPTALLADALIA